MANEDRPEDNLRHIHPLVSIVIPCYNAQHWLAESIESALNQTYPCTEVIVVDDGSTDDSRKILQDYEGRIRVEYRPHLGGNAARNHGFAVSKGEFIQYLDADDYILPEKIQRQVQFLQETGADVVYGDWRHQFHEQDGNVWQGPVVSSGEQKDVLASLLSNWWISPAALLYRRVTVLQADGWDESLTAAQDRDFFTSVAFTGARILYQPGCHSIYRRYGNVTVSTSNRPRWLANHLQVCTKAEQRLAERGQLSGEYAHALANSYFSLARNYYALDQTQYHRLMTKVLTLNPNYIPHESRLYNLAWRLFGFPRAEWLALATRYRIALMSRLRTAI